MCDICKRIRNEKIMYEIKFLGEVLPDKNNLSPSLIYFVWRRGDEKNPESQADIRVLRPQTELNGKKAMKTVIPIKYCPFCGEKL